MEERRELEEQEQYRRDERERTEREDREYQRQYEEQYNRDCQERIEHEERELQKLMSRPTPTGPDYISITTRARNLAVTWTNSVEQLYSPNGTGFLRVEAPPAPTEWGGIRSCLAEIERARRINSGGVEWRKSLWVGNRRVIGVVEGQALIAEGATSVLEWLQDRKTITVKLAPEEA